jgi:methionine-rich copper-binding protein CopC
MKNLKKFLAVIVAVAVLASFTVPVLAEDEMTDAEKCEILGMLQGTGAGLTEEYLASTPMRYQAAIMYLRLKGLEADALDYTGEDTFDDATLIWSAGQNMLAYLKANPNLGWQGVGNNKFDPLAEITAQAYYKIILVALGYVENVDFAWANVIPFAASKGLLAVADADPFTVDDLATATIEALLTDVADGSQKLIDALIAGGFITEEDADAAGIYAIPAVPLAVVSVTATNMKEVMVKFNKALSASTVVAANFKVDGAVAEAVALQADGVTVKVTVPEAKCKANGGTYAVAVTADVKDTEGIAMTAYTESITVIDSTLPYVTGVVQTGPKNFEITFNEPIKTAGTVKINNGVFGVVLNTTTGTVIEVQTAATLPVGDYALSITGFKDYADLGMLAFSGTLTLANDTTPISATIKSATQTEVVVLFNKDVVLTDTATSYFYHTFTAWMPTTVTAISAKEYKLEFGVFPIPEGTSSLVVKSAGVAATKIKDLWGNTLDANITLPVTVTADSTAPTVVSVVAKTEMKVEITFSEAVNGGATAANFVIKDGSGTVVAGHAAAYAAKVTTLTWAANLAGGAYTVEISGITDTSLTANPLAAGTVGTFTISDLTAMNPAAITATAITSGTDLILYITFPEAPATTGQYSALNGDNYVLPNVTGGPKSLTTLGATLTPFGSSGKVVKAVMTTPGAFVSGTATADLQVGRIADAAGNVYAAPLSTTLAAVPEETAPTVVAVKVKDTNKLEIVVSKPLLSVLPEAFTVSGAAIAAIDSWVVNSSNQTVIQATLTAGNVNSIVAANAEYLTKTSIVISDGVAVALVGAHMVSETGKAAVDVADLSGVVKDYRAPVLLSVTTVAATTGDAIVLTFSEDMDGTTKVLAMNDIIVKNAAGTVLTAGLDYITATGATDDKIIIVKVAGEGLATGTYKVASKDAITYIRDDSAQLNKATPFTTEKSIAVVHP